MIQSETGIENKAIESAITQMLPDYLVDFESIELFLTYPPPDFCDERLSLEEAPITLECLWILDEAFDSAVQKSLSVAVDKALSTLREREQNVLRERYGFSGDEKTLEQVGEMLGVTRERIRQIEAKAPRRLRHPARSKHIKDFYE